MARKKRRSKSEAGELNLTAMIDVAFQLLSFFVITVHPVDVLAYLNVTRPAPSAAGKADKPLFLLRVKIQGDGSYTLNDQFMDKDKIDSTLSYLASLNKEQTVLIVCAQQSPHGKLVELLDLCAKVGLQNLSVLSER